MDVCTCVTPKMKIFLLALLFAPLSVYAKISNVKEAAAWVRKNCAEYPGLCRTIASEYLKEDPRCPIGTDPYDCVRLEVALAKHKLMPYNYHLTKVLLPDFIEGPQSSAALKHKKTVIRFFVVILAYLLLPVSITYLSSFFNSIETTSINGTCNISEAPFSLMDLLQKFFTAGAPST